MAGQELIETDTREDHRHQGEQRRCRLAQDGAGSRRLQHGRGGEDETAIRATKPSAVVSGAALGVAKLANRNARPKVLGIRIPDELIGNLGEQVEARSEDVRALSGQAKRFSRRIS